MSSKMLTPNALWEQNFSQGIDEAVETCPEIREIDQSFEEKIAFLRSELQKSGRKDLDPILLDISDHYRDLRIFILEVVEIALEEKTLAFGLVEMFDQKGWIDEETSRNLKNTIATMPSNEQYKGEYSK